jgi:hypothetical protein
VLDGGACAEVVLQVFLESGVEGFVLCWGDAGAEQESESEGCSDGCAAKRDDTAPKRGHDTSRVRRFAIDKSEPLRFRQIVRDRWVRRTLEL